MDVMYPEQSLIEDRPTFFTRSRKYFYGKVLTLGLGFARNVTACFIHQFGLDNWATPPAKADIDNPPHHGAAQEAVWRGCLEKA
jgi:hypothetical protein